MDIKIPKCPHCSKWAGFRGKSHKREWLDRGYKCLSENDMEEIREYFSHNDDWLRG